MTSIEKSRTALGAVQNPRLRAISARLTASIKLEKETDEYSSFFYG